MPFLCILLSALTFLLLTTVGGVLLFLGLPWLLHKILPPGEEGGETGA